ncbi:3-methyladenine DNA glycosylase AlkD [Frankia sp. AgKG'84/4]|nr:DNA alkylation repair protein [Frankia sp. AgKG'84/4]
MAADDLLDSLAARGDPVFAEGIQRYFPKGIRALGVSNAAVMEVASDYLHRREGISVGGRIEIAERVLGYADYHEEVLLGFALLHKVAKHQLDDDFLDRCEIWLARYVSNWAQCDDLCLKLLYPFFLGHLDLIPRTRQWVDSESAWARRAANVAVVKFVRRKVGKVTFELPVSHAFDNCTVLMHDNDIYVQKGCGWLLKVVGRVHPAELAAYLCRWQPEMMRDTYRYALEGLDGNTRASLMALGRKEES